MLFDILEDQQNSLTRLRTSPHANENKPDVFKEWICRNQNEKIKIQNQIQKILDKESVHSGSNKGNNYMDGSPLKEIKEEGKNALPKLKIKSMSRDETSRPV